MITRYDGADSRKFLRKSDLQFRDSPFESIFFDNLGSYKRLGPAKFENSFNDKLKL